MFSLLFSLCDIYQNFNRKVFNYFVLTSDSSSDCDASKEVIVQEMFTSDQLKAEDMLNTPF